MIPRDYWVAGVLGAATVLVLVPTLLRVDASLTSWAGGAVLVLPVLWVVLMYIANHWTELHAEFIKYAIVGFLAFAIDFAVLNMVSVLTGITVGASVGLVNVPGVLAGATTAYVGNRYWTFWRTAAQGLFRSLSRFVFVVFIGLLINSGMLVILTTLVGVPSFLSQAQWLNAVKVIATGVVVIWNFFGYKFIAFRS